MIFKRFEDEDDDDDDNDGGLVMFLPDGMALVGLRLEMMCGLWMIDCG